MQADFEKFYYEYGEDEWYWKILKLPLLLIVAVIHVLYYIFTLGGDNRLSSRLFGKPKAQPQDQDRSLGSYKKVRFPNI